MLKQKNGQSSLEYAVLIVVVAAALIALQIYMGRGVQGKLRESVDDIGEQYSAGKTTYKVNTEQTGAMETKETFGFDENSKAAQGVSYYKVVAPADTTRKTEVAEQINTTVAGEKLFE